MAQTKRHLVYFINKANKTDFHLVSFISGPTLALSTMGPTNNLDLLEYSLTYRRSQSLSLFLSPVPCLRWPCLSFSVLFFSHFLNMILIRGPLRGLLCKGFLPHWYLLTNNLFWENLLNNLLSCIFTQFASCLIICIFYDS